MEGVPSGFQRPVAIGRHCPRSFITDAEEVEQRLTGNLCRCSGNAGLRQAIAELIGPQILAQER